MGQEESVQIAGKPRIQLGYNGTACRHLTLLTPVGVDCKELMNGVIAALKDGKIDRLQEKIVVILDRETFVSSKELMPSYAIVGNMFSDHTDLTEMGKGFEWMIKHPGRIVFVIYSLDEFSTDLQRKRPLIRYYKSARPATILHNILSGHLFSESRIISSASLDKKKLQKIHLSILPDHCLVLEGMTKSSLVLPTKEFIDNDRNLEADLAPFQGILGLFDDRSSLSGETTARKDLRGTRTPTAARSFCKSMLNEDAYSRARSLIKCPDLKAKREILVKRLKEAARDECDEERRLELFHSLYAGGKGSIPVIETSVQDIDLSEVSLSLPDILAVTFVIKHAKRLKVLNLRKCDLDDDKLARVAESAQETNVKIDEIEVAGNHIGPRGMHILATMIVQCRARAFRAGDCGLESVHIENFIAATHNSKVQLFELDVSSNDLGPSGMFHLGTLIKQCKVKNVDASNCRNTIDHSGIQNFVKAAEGAYLDSLVLTDLKHECNYSPALLSLMPLVKKELCVRGWRIKESSRMQMQKKLNSMHPSTLKVYLSGGIELRSERV